MIWPISIRFQGIEVFISAGISHSLEEPVNSMHAVALPPAEYGTTGSASPLCHFVFWGLGFHSHDLCSKGVYFSINQRFKCIETFKVI